MTGAVSRPGAQGLADRLGPWVRRFGTLRLITAAVAIAAFGYLWIRQDGRFMESTIWQAPLILELLLLSLPWRTVSARSVGLFFFIGFGPVLLATVASQWLLVASPLNGWLLDVSSDLGSANFGFLGNVHATVWAPITEEIWKVVPLLAVLWWGRSHLRTQGGPLDFAILAAATGTGLGFAEDLFVLNRGPGWTVPDSPILGLGVGTVYTALVVNPLNLFNLDPIGTFEPGYQAYVGILNPAVEELREGVFWAGHGATAMLIGLAIGFAVLGRRRYRTPLVWLLPAVVLLWSIWHHFIGNWYLSTTCERDNAPTLCGLAGLDLVGGLFALVAIAGWALGMWLSHSVMSRHAAQHQALSPSRREVSVAAYRGTGVTWPLRFFGDLLHYLAMRGRSAFGTFHVEHARETARRSLAEPLVAARLQTALLAARLRNRPLPAPPARIAARMHRLLGGQR